MELRLADDSSPNNDKWVLFLEGGGWCYGATEEATIAACKGRARFHGEKEQDETPDYGGVMSSNSTTNPDFFNWNSAFLHYCDGTSFASSRSDPIESLDADNNTALMYMRGRNIFDADINFLQTEQGMEFATEIILTGGSAGGLAVFFNIDHLAEELVDPSVRVTGFPDAGFFMDDQEHYAINFQGADPVWNVTGSGSTDQDCLAQYGKDEQWKCLLSPFLTEHIKTDLYVINSAFDAWQLTNNVVGCFHVDGGDDCEDDSDVQNYGIALRERLVDGFSRKPASRNGAFIDSCYVHEQNVNYCFDQDVPNCVGWDPRETGSIKWGYTTSVNGLTPQQAFSLYYNRAHGDGNSAEDMVIDTAKLQENLSCKYIGVPPV